MNLARISKPTRLVCDQPEIVAKWVGERTGIEGGFNPVTISGAPYSGDLLYSAIGVADDFGRLLAGAVYNNWRHPNIEITFAVESNRWASREAIACILRYPFVQLKCLRITAYTAARNDRARAFLTNPLIGFTQEGYHPNGFPSDDAVSYGLLREKCRWVKPQDV